MTSLYLHIPFCKSKCAYCSFYSLSSNYKEEYINSLIRYVKFYGGKTLKTVYIGGGTPSVLSPGQITDLLTAVRENFIISDRAEITVEANPESLDGEFLNALRQCGVNRLSLGIQSFRDSELKSIGRIHTAKDALRAVSLARSHGFENISCDLIFGLPNQRVRDFEYNVKVLKDLDIPHISCYNLQVEKGTAIYGTEVPDEEIQAQMYEKLCEQLSDYIHYEISNFCKDGFQSRHNSVYWTGGDYLGLGPSAHSKMGDTRAYFDDDLQKFISKDGFSFDCTEKITDAFLEKLMLGLRTDRGVEINELNKSEKYIYNICKAGFGKIKDGRLVLTDKGFYLSNTIISDIAKDY